MEPLTWLLILLGVLLLAVVFALKVREMRRSFEVRDVDYLTVSDLPPGYKGEQGVWMIDTAAGPEFIRARLRGPDAIRDDA